MGQIINKALKNKLNEYVDSKVTKNTDLLAALRFTSKSYGMQMMRQVFNVLKSKNEYITAMICS